MKVGELIKTVGKYKYALIAALFGVLLMVIPFGSRSSESAKEESPAAFDLHAVEKELEELLSSSPGVGKVKVMLTLERSEEVVYMTEGSSSVTEGGSDEKSEVSKVNGDKGEEALVRSQFSPVWRGAVILCEGAEDDGIRLRVTAAVSSLLGIGSDRIAILPMNGN